MMDEIKQITLKGKRLTLEPLTQKHAESLFRAGRNPEVWMWMTRHAFKDLDDTRRWIDYALHLQELGEQLPFAIVDNSNGIAVGSTRISNIDLVNMNIQIGHTWLAPKYWNKNFNSSTKMLLLEQAFDKMHMNRVQFVTDNRNIRAKKSLEHIGAHLEGVLRHHRIGKDGEIIDSVIFSVISDEWPAVESNLRDILELD